LALFFFSFLNKQQQNKQQMDTQVIYGGHIRLPTLDAPMEEIIQGAHTVFNNPKAAPATAKAWSSSPMVAEVIPKLRQLLLRDRGIVMVRLNLATAVYACNTDTTVYIIFRTVGSGISCHRFTLRFSEDVDPFLAALKPCMANETETALLIMASNSPNSAAAAVTTNNNNNNNNNNSPKGHHHRQSTAGPLPPTTAVIITPAAVATVTAVNNHQNHNMSPPNQRRMTLSNLFGGHRSPDHDDSQAPTPLATLLMTAGTAGSSATIDRKLRGKPLRVRRHTSPPTGGPTGDEPTYDVRTMAGLSASTISLDSGCGTEAATVQQQQKARKNSKKNAMSRSMLTLASPTMLIGSSESDGEDTAHKHLDELAETASAVGGMSIGPSNTTTTSSDEDVDDLDDNAVNSTPLDDLRRQDYYHGVMTWQDAVIRLGPLDQGCFLVRATATDEQDFVISVINNNDRVSHLGILNLSGKYHVTGFANASFYSVPTLIAHHMKHRTVLSGCVLRTPLSK